MIKVCLEEEVAALDVSGLVSFSRLRRYPGFPVESLVAILRADLISWLADGGRCLVKVDDAGKPLVLACLHRLRWDTDHFAMPMLRLQIFCSAGANIEDVGELVRDLLSKNFTRSGEHISAEVDIDDYASLNALLGAGFQIFDLRRTYCTNRMRHDIDFVRMRSRVRPYCEGDRNAVMKLVSQVHFPSRFSRDPSIPAGLVAQMYEKWFATLLQDHGAAANAVVYERKGEVVACGAIGERSYRYAGVDRKIRTGSLYAGRADAVGAYTPVLYQLIVDALESHGLVDTTASMNNTTVCRVLEGFRSYKSAAASYSLSRLV
ncbi:hypothetical protein [Alcanivorax sp. 1008]|uniref:hypothetical protein n=1 Tax=Alcanivorax sp. 1008 TaxID=2816853 RepID=UPI001D9D6931|nr:hypothetical protein [Alcanivorax sp. 1008]MCC1498059.1 hypothetical protein [Alcanivorax sp. 1008]